MRQKKQKQLDVEGVDAQEIQAKTGSDIVSSDLMQSEYISELPTKEVCKSNLLLLRE